MKKIIILLLFIHTNIFGQPKKIECSIGLSFESSPFRFEESRRAIKVGFPNDRMSVPFRPSRNLQGIGIPLFLKANLFHHKIAFEYIPTFRYDEVHFDKIKLQSTTSLFINQSLYLSKNVGKYHKTSLKTGVTTYNPLVQRYNKKVRDSKEKISFSSVDIGFSRKLKTRISFEIIGHFFPYLTMPITAETYTGASHGSFSAKFFYKLNK